VILSFKDKDTEQVWNRRDLRRMPPELQRAARRKLIMINAAERLEDLASPPGNRLESLKGDRAGLHSIRINDRFRICFIWTGKDAEDVEIVDYH
jgi:proteic killer suppression protein